jgi:hypothetical protein
MLRQLAYRENSVLLPPETDPEGWFVLQRASVKQGIDVVLALAKPVRSSLASSYATTN